jgi:hypothetical protein
MNEILKISLPEKVQKRPKYSKIPWSTEEDEKLVKTISEIGTNNWSIIA